jgi:hypothetical protein
MSLFGLLPHAEILAVCGKSNCWPPSSTGVPTLSAGNNPPVLV